MTLYPMMLRSSGGCKGVDRVEESEKKVGDGDNNGYDGISGSKGLPF